MDVLLNFEKLLNNYYEINNELDLELFNFIKLNILNNSKNIMYENFHNNFIESIYELYNIQLNNYYEINNYIKYKLKYLIVKNLYKIYKEIIPIRSFNNSFIRNIKIDRENIKKINNIKNTYQPEQRTKEWYIYRHKHLTASSIWKVFKSESTKNELIYEKCKDYVIPNTNNTNSPLHWGHKYEPLSVKFYENLYDTKIGDFGCIEHKKYNFIAASPDGINIDSKNLRYGRMLEIKNIVNRKINGIPKFEYWIQMQIQMETCDLNECDFLETKFVEYNNFNEFMADGTFNYTKRNKLKGIILVFNTTINIHYEYAPLNITQNEFEKWEKNMLEKNNDKEWVQNIYWYLEFYSNILVLRNKKWFNSVIEDIEKISNIINNEKTTGYEHRKSKTKKKIQSSDNKCLININNL